MFHCPTCKIKHYSDNRLDTYKKIESEYKNGAFAYILIKCQCGQRLKLIPKIVTKYKVIKVD
jgi:hypothetical protein